MSWKTFREYLNAGGCCSFCDVKVTVIDKDREEQRIRELRKARILNPEGMTKVGTFIIPGALLYRNLSKVLKEVGEMYCYPVKFAFTQHGSRERFEFEPIFHQYRRRNTQESVMWDLIRPLDLPKRFRELDKAI